MHKVQNADEPPRQEMHLEERPVVLLAVADTGFAACTVQAATLHLGRHLPTEGLTVGHGRHHRTHPLARRRPPPFFATLLLGWRSLGTSERRSAAPFHLRRQ